MGIKKTHIERLILLENQLNKKNLTQQQREELFALYRELIEYFDARDHPLVDYFIDKIQNFSLKCTQKFVKKQNNEKSIDNNKTADKLPVRSLRSYKRSRVLSFRFDCALETEIGKNETLEDEQIENVETTFNNNVQVINKSIKDQTKDVIKRVEERREKCNQNRHFLSQI